jgi:FkbM family methyltransferase
VPPIVRRAAGFVRRRVFKAPVGRVHPFDAISPNLDVKWLLDVGANKGDVTTAALRTYAGAKAICFEPVSETFSLLEQAVSAFPGRTHLYKVALSNRAGEEAINITTFNGANSISDQTATHRRLNPHVHQLGTEKISLVRLDDIATELPAEEIDVLKIDVEGHELNVLEGGREFISRRVDTIIIEISMMRDVAVGSQGVFPIFSILNDMGFVLTNVIDIYSSPTEEIQLLQMDCVFRHGRKFGRI